MKSAVLVLTASVFLGCARNTLCIDESKINNEAVCIQVYDPVCGCDGTTYGNTCMAESYGVLHYIKGECP